VESTAERGNRGRAAGAPARDIINFSRCGQFDIGGARIHGKPCARNQLHRTRWRFSDPTVASQLFYDCCAARILLASSPCEWIAALVCKLRPPPVGQLCSERGMSVESIQDDCFIVFLRHDRASSNRPDCSERPLTKCSSYEEARRIQRELHHTSRICVIRYVGPAGGGD